MENEKTRKQVRIRLYRVQDYDLYRLYFDDDFDLGKAFAACVTAYANRQPAPAIVLKDIAPLPKNLFGYACIETSFELTDPNAIHMLACATKNEKNANNFCKALLKRSFVNLEELYLVRNYKPPKPYKEEDVPEWEQNIADIDQNEEQLRSLYQDRFLEEREICTFKRSDAGLAPRVKPVKALAIQDMEKKKAGQKTGWEEKQEKKRKQESEARKKYTAKKKTGKSESASPEPVVNKEPETVDINKAEPQKQNTTTKTKPVIHNAVKPSQRRTKLEPEKAPPKKELVIQEKPASSASENSAQENSAFDPFDFIAKLQIE